MDIAIQATEDGGSSVEEETKEEYDFNYPFLFSDMVLVVQNERLHCHRAILSLYSPVFKTMFQSKFEETSKNQVSMPQDDPQVVRELLRHLYTPGGREMDSAAAERLLPLIHRYQIDSLVSTAERTLTYSLTDSLAPKMLSLADLYGLERLKQAAIDSCSRLDMPRLSAYFDEAQISTDLRATVFAERIKLLEKYVNEIQNSFTRSCVRLESRLERVPVNHCQDHSQPLSMKTVRIGVHSADAQGGAAVATAEATSTNQHEERRLANELQQTTDNVSITPDGLVTRLSQSTLNSPTRGLEPSIRLATASTSGPLPETAASTAAAGPELAVAELPVVCESCVEHMSTYIKDLCKRALHKATFVPYKPPAN
nr:unnamed protein product [Spirometra erinaceieuropaei]